VSTPSDRPSDREPSSSVPGRAPHPAWLIFSSSTLLARGVVLLFLSFILAVVISGMSGGDARGRVAIGWVEQASFWLGIICTAGDVLREVLANRKP